jgi:hypothetical protein
MIIPSKRTVLPRKTKAAAKGSERESVKRISSSEILCVCVCVKCERSELFIRNLAGKIISLYFFNISIFGEFEFWIQLSYKALDIIKFKLVTFSVCSWKNDIVWFEYVLTEISNLIIQEFYTH